MPTPESVVVVAQEQFLQAFALHQRGVLDQAQALYTQVLDKEPNHVDALHLSGVAAFQCGNYQEAADLIERAIALRPGSADFYINRGAALRALKEYDSALASYDRSISLRPGNVDAWFNRGNALHALKRFIDAVASFDRALSIQPRFAEAWSNRGISLFQLSEFEAALASYDRAVALRPDYPEAWSNRGLALQELKELDAAIDSYQKAIELRPNYAEAWSNRGLALQQQKHYQEALASCDRSVEIMPEFAEAWSNRGMCQHELKRFDEAAESYDRAIALRPDYAEPWCNKSHALLIRGEFERGFELHEWRWKKEKFTSPRRDFQQPLWLGGESIEGKRILLHSEQGNGDTIQFCRYAPLVAAFGATVIMEVQEQLVGLVRELKGVAEVIAKGERISSFDLHCPLLSLPFACKTTLDTIPFAGGYLKADPLRLETWRDRLGPGTKPRVGLVWNGNSGQQNDHNRSCPLSAFIRHLPAGFHYVSLQKELRDSDREALEGCADIVHFGEELLDFSDTAALIELMDIVVGVDTSVTHLAGALGKTVWITLSRNADWRWLLDRTDSPFYSSATLYRQELLDDWDGVLRRVMEDLSVAYGR